MNKVRIGGVLIVVLLLIGSAAVGVNRKEKIGNTAYNQIEKDLSMHFSMPSVTYNGNYASIKIDGLHSIAYNSGEPILPVKTKVLTFPLGTKVHVELSAVSSKRMNISMPIQPAYKPIALNAKYDKIRCEPDKNVYESSLPYPAKWYSYNLGGGLQDGKHVTFLVIQLHPVRYYPSESQIEYATEMHFKIDAKPPAHEIVNDALDAYDLAIIAPKAFENDLQPLVDFKNSHGMKTILMTVEDITSKYNGRDGAEKVKYAIKDAIEQYGIKYVLLVGGKKSLWTGNWGYDGPNKVDDSLWYVPVRYSALKDYLRANEIGESGYLSDLYFADIYDANGNFSSWDSNGNGKFAEWTQNATDVLDLYPDVYVGRWPARSENEVKTLVEKTIAYEGQPAGDWFNRMLLVGGDTFPGDQAGVYDGEYATSHEFSYMPSQFTATKLYASDKSLTGGKSGKLAYRLAWTNVVKTFSQGFGFVAFDGHGSPTVWATHPVGEEKSWIYGLMTYQMELLKNGNKLPIVSVGGCHNSEFNISFFDYIKNRWTYQPTFECWSWRLARTKGGGSIATLGYTGLGYGTIGDEDKDGIPDCVQRFGGYIEGLFFHSYGVEGKHVLGNCWGTAVQEYLDTFPIDWNGRVESDTQVDCKTVQEWALIGDPSLMIGGYS